jgi:8-oxo-dGTP pyrophosphatase MutT (NUDIX family)
MRPWKRLSSSTVVKDRWLHLTADQCELPDGTVIEPYYVIHEPEWVHVLAINEAGEVLVVRQYRYAGDTVCVELPGGIVDKEEELLHAATRELLEETGHAASSWAYAGSLFVNPARQTNRIHLFVATGLSATSTQTLDATENIDFFFLSTDEIRRAIDDGTFSQALHVACFYRGLNFVDDARSVTSKSPLR